MPGYYVHFAASNPETYKNRSFICGVETPDLLKKYFKDLGIAGTERKYNNLKTNEMPNFFDLKKRVGQIEKKDCSDGLHYGWSSCPNIMSFWNSLTSEQKRNPFYRGYLWHLLTDLLIYQYLDIENKLNKSLQNCQFSDYFRMEKQEMNKLYADWDKTNAKIKDTYPDVILPQEIVELNTVKFIDDVNLTYVDWDIIKCLIDYLRSYNPLDANIDEVIKEVLNILPTGERSNLKLTLSERLGTIERKV